MGGPATEERAASTFVLEVAARNGGQTRLRLRGVVDLRDCGRLRAELGAATRGERPSVNLDLRQLERLEGGGAAVLAAERAEVRARGGAWEYEGASDSVARMLELYERVVGAPSLRTPPGRSSAIEEVGHTTLRFVAQIHAALRFIGRTTRSLAAALRDPRTVHWRAIPQLMERAGADGVPIVALINFLVGFIMGLQAAEQLRRFGANIFVADLVGLSMTRELGPLMTAIIVAGRSGAAFAAELGTMRVSEEVDALRTLGIDPLRFLVFPRVFALCAVVPLLALLADIVGCAGGWLVAVTMLDLSSLAFVTQLREAIDPADVLGGLFKSGVFATVITLISCQRGLEARGGAAGVGSSTTSAVVTILFTLVLLDAAFTYLFEIIGI